ncbi:MAG: YjjG family noncanonical pyrimidine nucleotidase [Bacteroidetes bacterium]|nr:YjjG family noncanonical pyrimidine nucleotidase [Bacteroidota bacterium]
MKNITDVFFDLDHTLWDFDKNSRLAFDGIFNKRNIALSLDVFLRHYERINEHYWKIYREEKISSEDLRFHRLKDTFEAMQFAWTPSLIDELSEEYLQELTSHHHLIDGALDVLNYLKPKYKLHIITNGFDQVQSRKINGSGIKPYFETITTSEMAGAKKPHATIFEYALGKAKTPAHQSVMIGDNLEADIDGALQFGMHAVFFQIKETTPSPKTHSITQLSALKNLL